jgi:hypothetical protein
MNHCKGSPSEQFLESYVRGTLPEAEAEGFEEHYFDCPACLAQVEALQAVALKLASQSRMPAKKPIPWPRRARLWGAIAATLAVGFIGYGASHWALRFGNGYNISSRGTHPLPNGDEELVARLRDGDREVSLGKNGRLQGADRLPPDLQDRVKAALSTARLEANLPSGLGRVHDETMLGSPSAKAPFRVLSPLDRVVLEDRPRFAWEPMRAATGYRVRVYAEGYRKVEESPLVQNTSWQPPNALARGARYTWTVTAEGARRAVRVPAPPQPEAAFLILDARAFKDLGEAAQSFANDPLALAILFARAGAIDEACAQLDLLSAQNPGSSLVSRLRSSLIQEAPSPIRTKAAQ